MSSSTFPSAGAGAGAGAGADTSRQVPTLAFGTLVDLTTPTKQSAELPSSSPLSTGIGEVPFPIATGQTPTVSDNEETKVSPVGSPMSTGIDPMPFAVLATAASEPTVLSLPLPPPPPMDAIHRVVTASSLSGPVPNEAGHTPRQHFGLNCRAPPPRSHWEQIKKVVDHMAQGGDASRMWDGATNEHWYDLLAGEYKTPQERQEPLLQDEGKSLAILPFPKWLEPVWEMYKKSLASFWTVEEIDLASDMHDLERLKPNERRLLERILGMFAGFDRLVNDNLSSSFLSEISNAPSQCFYGFQLTIENIHSEVYAKLIQTYIKDKARQKEILASLITMPSVQKMADWARHFTRRSRASFGLRLVAFTAVEGIFFSASFCAIFWMKKRGLMPGLCFSNELISRDEGMHCDFGVLLYHLLLHKPSDEDVRRVIVSAVEIQIEFVQEALFCDLLGMNADMMSQYVQFCGDRLLVALGQEKVYNVANPFDWMVLISLQGKTNFFEKRVAEYAKAGVGVEAEKQVFSLDADF